MRVFGALAIAAMAITLASGCASQEPAGPANADETAHMVAQAKLTAHYIADLLLGNEQVVPQGMQPREADGKLFRYVGAAGVDQPRIVQVGIAGPAE